MKNKKIKIKRYKKSFTTSNKRTVIKKTIVFIIVLALIFTVGFLFAKPVINFVGDKLDTVTEPDSVQIPDSTPTDSDDTVSESTVSDPDDEQDEPEPPVVDLSQEATWHTINILDVKDTQTAQNTAKDLASQGITNAVVMLKDTNGNLYYDTKIPHAQGAKTTTLIDASEVVQQFKDNGITLTAYITAFQDAYAVRSIDRGMGVSFVSDENVLWVDNSPDMGGSPWLNPYNTAAQQYILDITQELYDLGFKQVVVSKLQFPSGYSTELAGYGVQSMGKAEVLGVVSQKLTDQAVANDAKVWVEVPALALSGINLLGYYESPFNIGIENLLVDIPLSRLEDGTVTTFGIEPDMLATFAQKAMVSGTKQLAVSVTNSKFDQTFADTFYNGATPEYTKKIMK